MYLSFPLLPPIVKPSSTLRCVRYNCICGSYACVSCLLLRTCASHRGQTPKLTTARWLDAITLGGGTRGRGRGHRKYIAINWVKFNWIWREKKVKAQHNGKLDLVLSFSALGGVAFATEMTMTKAVSDVTALPLLTSLCVWVCVCVKYGIDIRRS